MNNVVVNSNKNLLTKFFVLAFAFVALFCPEVAMCAP